MKNANANVTAFLASLETFTDGWEDDRVERDNRDTVPLSCFSGVGYDTTMVTIHMKQEAFWASEAIKKTLAATMKVDLTRFIMVPYDSEPNVAVGGLFELHMDDGFAGIMRVLKILPPIRKLSDAEHEADRAFAAKNGMNTSLLPDKNDDTVEMNFKWWLLVETDTVLKAPNSGFGPPKK
jgi:hypothetical protein